MDQSVLVESGKQLVRLMDAAGIPPRAALWVHALDTDTGSDGSWRLWIVPHSTMHDKRQFYRRISELVSNENIDLDAGDTEFISDKHPAVTALAKLFRITGDSSAHVANNLLNGFYLPDAIILRLNL